jgi:hypothetical protein
VLLKQCIPVFGQVSTRVEAIHELLGTVRALETVEWTHPADTAVSVKQRLAVPNHGASSSVHSREGLTAILTCMAVLRIHRAKCHMPVENRLRLTVAGNEHRVIAERASNSRCRINVADANWPGLSKDSTPARVRD